MFFLPYLLCIIIATITLSQIEKGDLVHWFGERDQPFWNNFWIFVTKLGEEYIYVIAVIVLIYRKYAYALMVPILGLTVGVLSWFLKDFFNQPRPLQFYKDLDQIEKLSLIENFKTMTGYSSFPSGHTFSAFAIYTFFALVSKQKWVSFICCLLAVGVALSRVYLNQHFLEDIYLGSILGVGLAIAYYYFSQFLAKKYDKLNKNYKKEST